VKWWDKLAKKKKTTPEKKPVEKHSPWMEISLRKIKPVGDFKFLYARMLNEPGNSFGAVHFSRGGVEDQYGMRFDLAKRAWLDHWNEPDLEAAFEKAKTDIFETVLKAWRK
jgi:hypothetical protein